MIRKQNEKLNKNLFRAKLVLYDLPVAHIYSFLYTSLGYSSPPNGLFFSIDLDPLPSPSPPPPLFAPAPPPPLP